MNFINAIVITVLLSFPIFQGDKKNSIPEGIKIVLASEADTCDYIDDNLGIIVIIKNTGSSRIRINKRIPISTQASGVYGCIRIKILHDNTSYISKLLDGKDAMPAFRYVTMKRPLVREEKINFKQLMKNIPGQFSYMFKGVDNTDFGVYKIQALFINSSNDTLASNWISVNYLKEK